MVEPSNLQRYASIITTGSSAQVSYRNAKSVLRQAINEDAAPWVISQLRDDVDSAAYECEVEWNSAISEAHDHYE